MNIEPSAWYTNEPEHILELLHTKEEGLDGEEVKKRLKQFGPNILQTKNTETIPRILWRQLHNPIVYVLLFSTFLSLFLRKYIDAAVVFCVVILNTLIGFFQEYRANRVIKSLSAMIPHKTTVIREGKAKQILSAHVVPGDIITLEAGDKISADLRLIFIKNLQCDESTLTGESLPVNKRIEPVSEDTPVAERKCMAYNGTFVTAGTGTGVVVETGFKTEFGRISELIDEIEPLETPLARTLKTIATWVTFGVLLLSGCLFVVGYLRGNSLFDSALAAVALAVAAIPEGFPAIITIASAIGVRRMAQRRAIMRQLPAVEAIGSASVICTDKTGTLTHNEMTVQRMWTAGGFSFLTGAGFTSEGELILPEGHQEARGEITSLLRAAMLCNDASLHESKGVFVPVGDPTEISLVIAGRKIGLKEGDVREKWQRDDVFPFDSSTRMMATLNTNENETDLIVKGAPEEILKICSAKDSPLILNHVETMAKEGMRVLAVAQKKSISKSIEEKDLKSGFSLLGLIGMIDPPRQEVYQALQACNEAGIAVKMVTGDHPLTAEAIGRDLGLLKDEKVLTGAELNHFDQEEWKEAAVKFPIFARVSPEHKLRLVEALQEMGHVVAMTGDGVNDAPALKRSDIGIAMGIKGTAVAKEAADMVLADDNFASIEAAVEEGRRVYDNLVKSLSFVFPTSLGQALLILIAVLFFPLHNGNILHPILPVQILWVNLVVAIALALPLAFEQAEPDSMQRPPRKKQTPILSGFILLRTITVAFLMAIGGIALFLWDYHAEILKGTQAALALSEAQTMTVTSVILFQIFYLFNCRSMRYSVFKIGLFSNPTVWIGIGFVLIAQLAFIYLPFMNTLFHSSPLSINAWLISTLVACVVFPVVALQKFLSRRL